MNPVVMQVIDVQGSPAVFTIKLLTVFEENFLYLTCGPECFILTFKHGVDAHLDWSWCCLPGISSPGSLVVIIP